MTISNRDLPWSSVCGGLILALAITVLTPNARANVYATNVRINGGATNITASAGDTISVSYLLNEPATLGTTLEVLSGTNVVTKFFVPGGDLGTLRGPNEVLWDNFGATLPSGSYSFSVVPASSGYTNWTQITSDTADLNTYVSDGRGITVDQNPASLYYGRVFVANSSAGQGSTPGDTVGILKFNADTSGADEGISSAGMDGHQWLGGHTSPWKMQVSTDDYLYVDDLANGGEIFRWDPTVSSNSIL
ncbi:MAG TPA: hypothetical protein VKY92_25470, partial [Verrucomicrobiae bacterium]|nr:hypothetical protein [Verrucomicrobiae bacterium]